ncbi:MAG: hypothetical protein WAT79_09345 [Saprospiraceae bacterium]
MSLNHFDKQIKDRVQFHQADINPSLWDKIESNLPRENKKRYVSMYWKTLSLMIVSVGLVAIYYYTSFSISENKLPKTHVTPSSQNVFAATKQVTLPYHNNEIEKNNLPNKNQPEAFSLNEKNYATTSKNIVIAKSDFDTEASGMVFQPTENNAQVSYETTAAANNFGQESTYSFLNKKKNFVFSDNSSELSLLNTKKIVVKDHCLEGFDKNKQGLIFEAFYGHDFPIRHLRATSSEFKDLVLARQNTESPLYAFSLGARLGFHVSENFLLHTGVTYSQINEKFEYVDPESSQTKIVKTTLYIKDGQGNIKDSTFTFDTIFIPGTLIYQIKNQYSMVDIPLLIGFHAIKGDKVNLHLNVGVLANIMFEKSGMALENNQYNVKNFSDASSNSFNNSLGISSYAGAQFSYNLFDKLSVFIEPNVRIQHRGLTSKDYPIVHKYIIASFNTGAKYNF